MSDPSLPEAPSAADVTPDEAFTDPAGDDAPASFTLLAAAEVQDHLMSVTNDLERLQRLLEDAGETLSTHFFAASAKLQDIAAQLEEGKSLAAGGLGDVLNHVAQAIIALQFQDMSTQLITHTSLRLRACADIMARDTFGDDGESAAVVEAPLRPNPVTQDEVDAGSVELF
jgi:hypothetical protein